MKKLKKSGRETTITVRIAPLLVFATLLLSAPLAQAVPITIEITGEVTNFSDGTGLLNTIHVGSIFSGTYTYDSTAPNTSSSGSWGKYVYNSPYGITLLIGGFEFKTDPMQTVGRFQISIGDNAVGNGTNDFYTVHSYANASLSDGLIVSSISWDLNDTTHTAISSTALPVTAPVLNAWDYNYVEIYGGDSQHGFYLGGRITQAVPEPATVALMITGVLLFRRKR